MSNALKQQGLADDPIRGTTTSGATREAPSKVIGLLTPGQHQFVMDDGDKDGNSKLIRLRTTNGTQLLLDDTSGHVYIISKAGENWMELSADGRIHIYGSKDISIHTQENLNLYADKSINIEAGIDVNIKAGNDVHAEAGSNVKTLAGLDTLITSGSTSNINSGIAHYETAGVIHMNGPTAASTEAFELNSLVVNQSVTTSICTTVPEHEPWFGHSGSINPVGPGNQQIQADPDPTQTPRQPEEGEQGSPIAKEESVETEVEVDEATTSEQAQAQIKENNKFTPVNHDDGTGQSGGFASSVADTPASDPNQTTAETARLNRQNAEAERTALDGILTDGAVVSNQAEQQGTKALDELSAKTTNPEIFTNGITPSKADQLFANDLKKNETSVKKLLSGLGTEKVPQNVFDSLVSFQNQTGDASYAYIKGEKIDLTSMYKNNEWDRAASFIAADERDRPRRIQEAAMMANNNYGNTNTQNNVVNIGFKQTTGMLLKDQLNKQTGNAVTPQQTFALGSSYFAQTGNTLPSLSFATNNIIKANSMTGDITQILKKQQGPWPY